MRKFPLAFCCLLVIFFEAKGQPDSATMQKYILRATNSMLLAHRTNNRLAYINYMHPALVKLAGGKEQFLKSFDDKEEMMKPVVFDTNYTGAVMQLVRQGKEYQCVVEVFGQLRVKDSMVSGAYYFVGTSANGRNWRFLRIMSDFYKFTGIVKPALSPALRYPESQFLGNTSLDTFLKTYKIKYLQPPDEPKP